MALEHNNCEPEHFISDIKDETESETDAIHDIIKEEIVKEEPIETKFFTSYAVYDKSHLEQSKEENFHKSDLLEENEVPSTDACKYMNFKVEGSEDDFASEQENPEDNCFNKIKIKHENQDYSEFSGDTSTNYHELKMETLKTEEEIDIEDKKPEICGRSEKKFYSNSTDILMETKIGPSFSQELPTDFGTGPQQRTTKEENETDAKWDNSTSKEPTITNNLNNGQIIHSKIFTLDKPIQCKSCSKSFTGKQIMLQHERTHTGEILFQCKVCSQSLSGIQKLVEPERIHTGEKPYQCKVCSKSFSGPRNLKTHGRVHTGEKPFQCKICSKSFGVKQNLKTHGRVHTGEKTFQCKFCSKLFPTKQILAEHERIHTGEKPFLCKICSKSFYRKQILERHERIHTGEKPFQCKVCSKLFSQKGNLLLHEMVHTGERPFHCKICSKSFGRKYQYIQHEKIHRKNSTVQSLSQID